MPRLRTPLAWANLTHDPLRFALFVLGIVFAVVLIFVQLGFRGALLDSQTIVHERLNADLVMVSPARQALAMPESFPRRRLQQARGVPGVRSVQALYLDNGAPLRDTSPAAAERGPTRGVRVLGVDPDGHALLLPELDPADPGNKVQALKVPRAALYDRLSRADGDRPGVSVYGPLPAAGGPPVQTELAGRQVTLAGSVAMGPDFTTEGALVVSADTFAELLRPYARGDALADVDLGLVRLDPGADPDAVRAELKRTLADSGDADVLTRAEFARREQAFWLSNTPIGFAFGFGMFMGFAVGLVICYQILSGDVADHLPEYATLKAVGYSNGFLAWVVVQESLILAVVGYAAGLLLSLGLYAALGEATGMPLRLSFERAAGVFAATVVMCAASGGIALGKLLRADPADVFA